MAVCLHAQTIFTAQASTPLHISPGTVFYADGLALTPSAGFTITNNSLDKTTTLANYTVSQYASRVYKFTNNTSLFSGQVSMFYDDAELSGMSESMLEINLHDDTQWWSLGTSAFDATDNYVISNAVSAKALNELTIANILIPLPVQWGTIQAFRAQQYIIVSWQTKQEQQIRSFTVERSRDGMVWQTVAANIPAKNNAQGSLYKITDQQYQPRQVYYRIKQTDFNGQLSYSNAVTVDAADGYQESLVLFPNPVTENFKLNMAGTDVVKNVQLYNNSGMLVKSWSNAPVYNVSELASGTYLVIATSVQNKTYQFKITKY